MDFFITVGAISSAITIAEQGNKLKKTLNRVIHFIANGKCRIIIFGSGGIGKTTLSYVLSNKEITDFEYKETINIEKVDLNSEIFGHYLVAPGQERRIERYWPELFRKIGSNKINGIINVVSYGYHSLDIGNNSYKTSTYYNNEVDDDKFLENYLNIQQEKEIRYLKKTVEHIKSTEKKIWMITLVNKQDLWWDRKEEVQEHYINGEYNSVIEEIYKSKGEMNFVHEYVSCSLLNSNFRIGNDFGRNTIQGYDEPLKRANYGNFLNTLNSLINE